MLFLDTETFSACDLRVAGSYRYAEDSSTECMLLTWAVDSAPVQCWDIASGESMPDALRGALYDHTQKVVAHKVPFDRPILKRTLDIDIPIERWLDSQVLALTMGLPPSLGELGSALDLPESQQKIKDGRRLIRKFCSPRKPSKVNPAIRNAPEDYPEDWALFVEYAIQDVETMRLLFKRIPPANYQHQLDLWYLDQHINERGVPLDAALINQMIKAIEAPIAEYQRRTQEITDGAVSNTTQRDKLLDFIRAQGVNMEGLTKADVSHALRHKELPEYVHELLEIRQQASKSSTAKLKKMLSCIGSGGRVRGTLQFCGAMRTGRWGGRLIQTQNLPSRVNIGSLNTAISAVQQGLLNTLYDDPMTVISALIRSTIAAPKGYKFAVADLSGIEARVLPWVAEDEETLNVFRAGKDIYLTTASQIYNIPENTINKDQRFVGKTATLACGYQGGKVAFANTAKNFDVNIPEELAADIVLKWREAHPTIVSFWYDVERAAKKAVNSPGETIKCRKVSFISDRHFLYILLPSGRRMAYYKPRVTNEENRFQQIKPMLSFMGVNQYTRKYERGQTYGGKLSENIVQGIARDILAANMQAIEDAGYKIIFHVHDEIVAQVPDTKEYTGDKLAKLMCIVPDWAEGLPLNATGETMKRYRK